MTGTSFFDYIHPEEKERSETDMKNIIGSKTLFGSVTRCRYSRIHRMRSLLGETNPRKPEELQNLDPDKRDYLAVDIVVNWIGEDMALCFFHAIMDESAQDHDESNKTEWSNWCGMRPDSFDEAECQIVWESIKRNRSLTASTTGPQYVFQILAATPTPQASSLPSDVLFSWPPPRLFSSPTADALTASAINFADGSYFVDDFARLAQGVNMLTLRKELSDANTSCTRRFRAKHTLTTEGMVRSVESVLIPYGSIVLACFSVTYAQMLPGSAAATAANTTAVMAASDKILPLSDPFPKSTHRGIAEGNQVSFNLGVSDQAGQQGVPPNGDPPLPFGKDIPMASLDSLMNASVSMTKDATIPSQHALDIDSKRREPGAEAGGGGSVATLAAVAAAAAAQTKRCASCGTSNSPEWRKGPDGSKSLCNACGLRFSRNISRAKKREERARMADEVAANGGIVPAHMRKQHELESSKKRKKAKAKSARIEPHGKRGIGTETGAAPPALTPTSTAPLAAPLPIVRHDGTTNPDEDIDDPSIQLARAAAQAAAAAGLRSM